MKVDLCVDCKHYVEGETEKDDKCYHEKAEMPTIAVRRYKVTYYSCEAMRAGICHRGKLFEANNEPRPPLEGN